MNKKGFVFSGMAFLLIVPAMLLVASLINMLETGDEATGTALRSDVVFYAWENVQSDFEEVCSSCVSVYGDRNDTIKDVLKNMWAPSVENDSIGRFGVNITIAKDRIEVLRANYSGVIYIKIGDRDNVNNSIPMNVSDLSGNVLLESTIDNGLGPFLIRVGAGGVTPGDTDPPGRVTLTSPCKKKKVDLNPTLEWEAATDPSGISQYRVQIATDDDFDEEDIIEDAYVTAPSITYPTTNVTVSDWYYWRVYAQDGAGNWNGPDPPNEYNWCKFRT